MSRQISDRGGMTLIELLVAMLLAALVMTAVSGILVQAEHLLTRVGVVTAMHNSASVTMNRISEEFKQSSWSTVTISTVTAATATVLAFRSADPDSQTVSFMPTGYFTIYYLANGNLYRKTWPLNTSTATDPVVIAPDPIANNLRLTAANLQTIVAIPNGSERLMISNVQSLALTPPTFPSTVGASNPATTILTIDLNCLGVVTATDLVRGQWHTAVVPRNP